MLLRMALILSLFTCLVPFAHADATSKLAKIQELFKITRQEQLTTQVMNQAIQQANSGMVQKLTGTRLSPEQQRRVDEFSGKVDKVIVSAVSWEQLEPALASQYADAYTEQQLDDMLAFYKSPTGQAVIEKTPILVKRSGEIA